MYLFSPDSFNIDTLNFKSPLESLTLSHATEMIISKIRLKKNPIKTRKRQVQEGNFEIAVDIIEFEIKNLQKDVEFFKALLLELD